MVKCIFILLVCEVLNCLVRFYGDFYYYYYKPVTSHNSARSAKCLLIKYSLSLSLSLSQRQALNPIQAILIAALIIISSIKKTVKIKHSKLS